MPVKYNERRSATWFSSCRIIRVKTCSTLAWRLRSEASSFRNQAVSVEPWSCGCVLSIGKSTAGINGGSTDVFLFMYSFRGRVQHPLGVGTPDAGLIKNLDLD